MSRRSKRKPRRRITVLHDTDHKGTEGIYIRSLAGYVRRLSDPVTLKPKSVSSLEEAVKLAIRIKKEESYRGKDGDHIFIISDTDYNFHFRYRLQL